MWEEPAQAQSQVVSQAHVLVLVSHISLISLTNVTLVYDTNAGTRWRPPHGKRKQ